MATTATTTDTSLSEEHAMDTKPTNGPTAIGITALPPNPKPEIGPITTITTKAHLSAAATLAEAFEHDDVARYPIDMPDCAHWSATKKWKLHCCIMNYLTYAHCLRGLVTATGPPTAPHASVALWLPPHTTIETLPVVLASGLWRLKYKLSRTGRKRFFRDFLPLLDSTKHSVLGPRAESCYYLVYIGTATDYRGLGLAARLIKDVSKRADEEGRAMYLESSNERNLELYRRLGFEVRRRIWLPVPVGERSVPLDVMVREPGGLNLPGMEKVGTVDSGVGISQETTRERGEGLEGEGGEG